MKHIKSITHSNGTNYKNLHSKRLTQKDMKKNILSWLIWEEEEMETFFKSLIFFVGSFYWIFVKELKTFLERLEDVVYQKGSISYKTDIPRKVGMTKGKVK